MKKTISTLLLCALLLGLLGFACAEAAADEGLEHRVLLTNKADSYSVYQLIAYAAEGHELKSVTIITHFPADSGVSEEAARSFNIEDAYPGIGGMDFVSQEIYTVDGAVINAVRFDSLDLAENKKKMMDAGYLLTADPAKILTSDEYVNSLNNYGKVKEVPPVDYEKLGFKF